MWTWFAQEMSETAMAQVQTHRPFASWILHRKCSGLPCLHLHGNPMALIAPDGPLPRDRSPLHIPKGGGQQRQVAGQPGKISSAAFVSQTKATR